MFINCMCRMYFLNKSTTLVFIHLHIYTIYTYIYLPVCFQLETIATAPAPVPPPDERTSFSQWIAARMARIPQDRWDDFQFAAMRLMQDYTSPTAQPRPMPRVQQQWANVPQQNFPQQNFPQQQHQQWGQTQAWQEQWPQQQKQVWPQPSSSGQPQIQLLDDTPVQPPAQPMRQTNEVNTLFN